MTLPPAEQLQSDRCERLLREVRAARRNFLIGRACIILCAGTSLYFIAQLLRPVLS